MIYTVTPFRGRHNYLKMMLATLREASRGLDVTTHLIDTSDTGGPYPEIIDEMDNVHLSKSTMRNPMAIHSEVINGAFKKLDTDWIVLIDSDMILHPRALRVCQHMVDKFPDMGIGSIFNTEEHPDRDDVGNGCVRKELVGFAVTIIKREQWNSVDRFVDDIGACAMMNKAKHGIYCTKKSYAEHMGFDGHNVRHHSIESTMCIDRARRFMND